jgi:uncharacterized Rossmann fold enzyme
MRYDEWEPLYQEILKDFAYSREKDELAARSLDELARGKEVCLEACLRRAIGGSVTVCGNGPRLERELSQVRTGDTLLAADGATGALMERGLLPDLIVTDLDGDIGMLQRANLEGAIAVIHAHGDNIDKLRAHVHGFSGKIALTTQSEPFGLVRDYGGFTDGDRAVELARHFGAIDILLLGFDFENPRAKRGSNPEVKRRKLAWARRIIFERNPPWVSLSTP